MTRIVPSFYPFQYRHHGELRTIVDQNHGGPNVLYDHAIVNYAEVLRETLPSEASRDGMPHTTHAIGHFTSRRLYAAGLCLRFSTEDNDMTDTTNHYAIIGAGPAGLAVARNLDKLGIPFVGFDAGPTVGGLWNIDNPRSTMYRSAHLISSKRMTEFKEFPMDDRVADYPHHAEVYRYFNAFADHFGLNTRYEFETEVTAVEPIDGSPGKGWQVTTRNRHNGSNVDRTRPFKGVVIANGILVRAQSPTLCGYL